MGRYIHKYSMELYTLEKADFKSYLSELHSDIMLVDITHERLRENAEYCSEHYGLWRSYLKCGAKGVFATYNGSIVGHAWLKIAGTKDTFYHFGRGVAYISEIRVDPKFRGRGIAPAMMSYHIENNPNYKFFISVYTSNVASRNALLKIGFSLTRMLEFVRVLKITWNKFKIRH